MACSTNCRTKDHATYGACLRDKGIQIDRFSLAGNGQVMEVRKNRSLDRYRQMRESGMHPLSPLKSDLDKAEAGLSDRTPPRKGSHA